MKRLLLFIMAICGLCLAAVAQRNSPPELLQRLVGKTRVTDVMREVNQYYDFGRAHLSDEGNDEDDFEGNDYDWWRKWEYWAMRRLLPNGDLANYKALNYLAAQQVEARFGQQLQDARQSLSATNSWATEGAHTAGITGQANRSFGNWSFIGPFDGGTVVNTQTPATEYADIVGVARMDRISFHPTDVNTMYTGSPSGGVFKTTNGGASWTAIGDGLPSGVGCVEVAHSNGNVVYVFTGDGDSHRAGYLVFNEDVSPVTGGMYKSTDGGNTWTRCADMYTGAGNLRGFNISISQNNSNYLFAATSQGVYRTTDGGNNWTQVRSGLYYDVEFRPYDDSTVYACTATAIQVSSDGGRTGTWTSSTISPAPSPAPSRIDLGVRGNNLSVQSTYVYALMSGSNVSNTFSGVYLSTDIGQTFNRQSNAPNILSSTTAGTGTGTLGDYGVAICVNPTNAGIIATAGLCVWRSNGANNGTAMVYSSTYRERNGPAAAFVHPDVHDVQYNPLNNNLYTCTDGGVYRSADDGVTWTNISTGLAGTQFYHMKMKDSDGNGEMNGIEMIAGAQDNGVKLRTSSGAWRHFYCCDGFDGVMKGSSGDYVVANYNDGWTRSANGGVTLTNLGSTAFFTPFAIDFSNDDTMYAASSSLRRSYDGFQTYTTLAFDLNNFITTCPSNTARLYGSSSSKTNLRRSDDRGATWTTKSGTPGWPAGSPIVTDCKPWPSNSLEIYASFGGYTDNVKVYRSLDGGDNWVNYTGSLPNVPVHSLCVAAEGVYAGTEIGVFFRKDGAADWTPFYTGMPKALITDMWVNENGFIYASTFGRGAWLADRYSVCDNVISVAGVLDGPQYFEANTTANVTATSQGGTGTDIFVKSNGYVDLLTGFEIKDGTFFKAYIGPCGTGGIPVNARFGATGAATGTNIVEYNARTQRIRNKQASAYYTLVADGIEVNLPEAGELSVEVVNTKTGTAQQLANKRKLVTGMYKILTDEGNFAVKVLLNGKPLPRIE
ncbi:MAG: hypothetical protein JWQ27_2274 [Ferruginibacter sp.]|nr:hypothetical protein [Ferruginibacter sp.]